MLNELNAYMHKYQALVKCRDEMLTVLRNKYPIRVREDEDTVKEFVTQITELFDEPIEELEHIVVGVVMSSID